MRIIQTLNSAKSIDQVLFSSIPDGFIHRRNKSTEVRFNPKIKEFFNENNLTFAFGYDEDSNEVFFIGGNNYNGKMKKTAHQKAKNLTDLLDMAYHNQEGTPKTNRYTLTFVERNDNGYVWKITPAEEVEENTREIDEATKQRLLAQLEKGRATRNANKDEEYTNVSSNVNVYTPSQI